MRGAPNRVTRVMPTLLEEQNKTFETLHQEFEDLVLAHSRSNAERHGISDWTPSERMSRLLELLQDLGTHTSATPWLGGERPNMADCIAGASLRTLINVGKLEQNTSHIAAVLYREPRVMDWLQRLDAVVESAA